MPLKKRHLPLVASTKSIPKNKNLWEKIQKLVKGEMKSFRYKGETIFGPRDGKGFQKFPSSYANQWAAKLYKSLGGKWQTEANFLERLETTAKIREATRNTQI